MELLAVGVDRVDYTKGIPERFRAIERLMDIHPQYRGRFTLVQIGAPSRTDIGEYQRLMDEVVAQAERINRRFQTDRWKPIVLLMRHHSHQEIARYYRVADVCLVTSLHDGMNLVAKEFVAAREDNRGVLVLSTFTGAALELTDALLVNPYDVDQMAEAIHRALVMPINEQTERMRRMRRIVGEHNVLSMGGTAALRPRGDSPRCPEPRRGRMKGPLPRLVPSLLGHWQDVADCVERQPPRGDVLRL